MFCLVSKLRNSLLSIQNMDSNLYIYLPAPLSLTSTCSDIVIFEDLLADRREEYKTQHIQTMRPIMLSLSKPM